MTDPLTTITLAAILANIVWMLADFAGFDPFRTVTVWGEDRR